MDKIILNNNTSLEVQSITTLTNGLTFTFKGQTIDNLEALLTKENLSIVKIKNDTDEIYATYNSLFCLSITKIISTNTIVATLYQEDSTQERISTLENQSSEMLLALMQGGLI